MIVWSKTTYKTARLLFWCAQWPVTVVVYSVLQSAGSIRLSKAGSYHYCKEIPLKLFTSMVEPSKRALLAYENLLTVTPGEVIL